MRSKVFSTNSGEIHYWISDSIDDSRLSLIFLPGLTADHGLFDKQIEHFEPSYNVFAWDAPGHASSFPFELSFTLADKAKWLRDILSSEGINECLVS